MTEHEEELPTMKRCGPLRTVWPWYKPYRRTWLNKHREDVSVRRCFCCGRLEVCWKHVCGTCAYWYASVKEERARRMQARGMRPTQPEYPFAERFVSAMRCAYFNLKWVHATWPKHSALLRATAQQQEGGEPE